MHVEAPSEDHARDIAQDFAMDHTDDVKLSYDFCEINEIRSV